MAHWLPPLIANIPPNLLPSYPFLKPPGNESKMWPTNIRLTKTEPTMNQKPWTSLKMITTMKMMMTASKMMMMMSTEAIHGRSELDLLLLCDDQTTWVSPWPRAGSQEACQPSGMETIAQASKPRLAMLTGEVSAEDIQYSKEACNIAISGNIKHPVFPLRLSAALSFT